MKLPTNSILEDYNSADGNYGYYENVYEDLTEEIVQNLTEGVFKFPGENPSVNLNGAKSLLDTSVKNGTAFSSGEDEFMSVDDTADQTQATQQDSVPQGSSGRGRKCRCSLFRWRFYIRCRCCRNRGQF